MNFSIPDPDGRSTLKKANGVTSDIIAEVLGANKEALETQTVSLARNFSKDRAGMELLWHFVKGEINYEEDPGGVQWIREPARLWADGVGDCKSFTLFICAILKNLGISHTIRFCTYDIRNRYVTHVYPIAHMPDGQIIILDAVWKRFDDEKEPKFLTTDYFFDMDVFRLSGIGDVPADILDKVANFMQQQANQLPGYGIDITNMSEREVIAFLTGNTISGIGSNANAFRLPVLILPDNLEIGKVTWKGTVQKAKNVVTAPAKAIGDAVKKLINWVFQTGLKSAGPYFVFSFIKNRQSLSPRINQKIDKREKIISWIAKTCGTSEAVAMASIAKGIQDAYGQSPEDVIRSASDGKIGRIGVVVSATIVTAVIEIISQLVKFFKKKDAPQADADGASNPDDLKNEEVQQQPTSKEVIKQESKTIKPPPESDDVPYNPPVSRPPMKWTLPNDDGNMNPEVKPRIDTTTLLLVGLGIYLFTKD